MTTASDAFRDALLRLVEAFVETPADAKEAIDALHDRAQALEDWTEKQEARSR